MTKHLVILLITAALFSGCATMNQQADPTVGQWEFQLYDLPRGNPIGVFTIIKEGDEYLGTVVNTEGEYPFSEVVIEGNQLVNANFVVRRYSCEFSGVFEGDAFTGQVNADGNIFTMTAVRKE